MTNKGEVKGKPAKAAGSTDKMAQGIKRRSCRYVALLPNPCEILR